MMNKKSAFIIVALILITLTLATSYYGSIDTGDYADTAKYFAGEYRADIRSSHSYLYGFIHSPIVKLTESFLVFKITSLIFLALIIYSVYRISNKNEKALWLIALSPILWYMAPWINPIQLASLCLLWGWHFMRKYDATSNLKNLVLSAFLIGLGWAFWDTVLFFGVFLAITFLLNKKTWHVLLFLLFLIVGLSPRLILDQAIFNFPFYTILKSSLGNFQNIWGGIYDRPTGLTPFSAITALIFILSVPQYFWAIYRKEFNKEIKTTIFISLSLLLILYTTQIRYFLALIPIITVVLSRNLNSKQFTKQIAIYSILIVLFVFPYAIQISYGINKSAEGIQTSDYLYNPREIYLISEPYKNILSSDLNEISKEFSGESFIVEGSADSYSTLARYYWGEEIKEFVSSQDYKAWLNKEPELFEKVWKPIPKINERRQIWVAGGVSVNQNDETEYEKLKYVITFAGMNQTENLKLLREYKELSVWEKTQ
jgi:hypothetical protein